MKRSFKDYFRRTVCAGVIMCLAAQPVFSATLNLAQTPLYLGASIPPYVMLDISKDQQLYKKAYNDFSDLDGDGVEETTYKHSIDYYGYFDSYKCYDYTLTNSVLASPHFVPFGTTTDKYCTGTNVNKWSGNFLNWSAMTRMDAVRKLLYGGTRVVDTATTTVLERAFLPTDAHSFAKYYAGSDIARLTPFNPPTTPDSSASTSSITTPASNAAASFSTNQNNGTSSDINGNLYTFSGLTTAFAASVFPGDQVRVKVTATPANGMIGAVVSTATNAITIMVEPGGVFGAFATNSSAWTVENLSSVGLSMCNTTWASTSSGFSHTVTAPPLIRVATGNSALWSANERWQCQWQEDHANTENGFSNAFRSNGSRAAISGINARAENPIKATHGLGQREYVARVEACVTGLFGTEKCKEYNQNGFSKPIGLLQVYGDTDQIRFGLMTGSYHKNISGGALRKRVGSLSDEVNSATDGTFIAAPAAGSIIGTLDKLRITGYNYGDGTYLANPGDNCTFQKTDINNDQCRSWGNPMSEVYYESLRYFAGQTSATSAFSSTDSDLLSGLTTAAWPTSATAASGNAVLNNNNYCTPLNILVFNPSVTTNDHDEIGNPFNNSALSSFSATTATNTVGIAEQIGVGANAGTKYFIGQIGGSTNQLCDAKTFDSTNNLGNADGVCPEGPTLGGSYQMAGLAYTAHVNRIRTDLTVPSNDTRSLKVNTYGISLATNVPRIAIAVPGSTTGQQVIIQPAYRLDLGGANVGGGTLVDMKIVNKTATNGTIYLNWEDSEQGGDYDQDVWGVLNWNITGTTISVTTNTVSASTANGQGFGYIISGTTKDGPHFHSGILGFNYTDPTNVPVTDPTGASANGVAGTGVSASGGCANCQVSNPATTATYTLTGTNSSAALQDPLWYVAKYGGFKDLNGNNLPDQTAEWDVLNANGSPGSDGVPDNFFLVSNPLGLYSALDKAFTLILATSAASSVATNSTSLNTGSKVYQARFNASDWSGQVLSFGISTSGVINTTPDWDAGQVSLGPTTIVPNNRAIITDYATGTRSTLNARAGIPFRWPANPASPTATELTVAQTNALRADPTVLTTIQTASRGSDVLNFLRGDGSNEGIASTDFRRRQLSKLGDTVNSNPIFVGPPNAGYADATYSAFRNTYLNRTPMLYTGASDGMLHAFNATSGSTAGAEVMAYIPHMVYRNLSQLSSKTYVHRYFVDGSPEVQDAKFTKGTAAAPDAGSWKTVLVGGLGGGGQGVYALDVTNPNTFSEANASSAFLWTFDDQDDPDVGNVYGNVSVRKMANGKWAAIFGSGYNNSAASVAAANAGQAETDCTAGNGIATAYTPANCTRSLTGYAFVFVVYLSGPTGGSGQWVNGTDYVKIPAGTVGSAGTPNGLISPFALDKNLDGLIDYIYAGDLNGNLWKFDVSSTTTTDWSNTTNQKVLFAAGSAQPITSSPIVAKHISGAGFMVNFGTGKYVETADVSSTPSTQSYYGIWDKDDVSPISGQTVAARTELMPQWVLAQTTVATQSVRVTTNHQPNYTSATRTDTLLTEPTATSTTASTPAQKGWYFDFPGTPGTTLLGTPLTGERAAFDPLLISGRLIFTSLLPSAAACDSGGSSYLMLLNNQTGGVFANSTFDVNRDGTINSSDLVSVVIGGVTVQVPAAGVQSSIGITPTPTIIGGGGSAGLGGTITVGAGAGGGVTAGSGATGGVAGSVAVLSGSSGATSSVQLNLGRTSGRISWREVFAD